MGGGGVVRAGRGEAQLARLRGMLGEETRRARAIEVVADLLEGERACSTFARADRKAAERVVRARILARHAEAIRTRARIGATAGLIAAAVWTPTVGFLLMQLLSWMASGELAGSLLLGALMFDAIILPIALLCGALFGWRAAAKAAHEAALHRRKKWYRVLAIDPWLTATPLVISTFIWMLVFTIERAESTRIDPELKIMALWTTTLIALLQPAISVIADLYRAALRGAKRFGSWSWSLLGAAGLPVLIAGAIATPFFRLGPGQIAELDTEAWLAFTGLWGLLVSMGSMAVSRALVRCEEIAPIGDERSIDPRRRSLSRVMMISSVAASMSGYVLLYGPSSIPLLNAPVVLADRAVEISPSFGIAFPNAAIYRVVVSDGPRVVRVISPASYARFLSSANHSGTYVLANGRHDLQIRRSYAVDYAPPWPDPHAWIEPVPFLRTLTPTTSTGVARVILEREPSLGSWHGELRLGVSGVGPRSVVVRVAEAVVGGSNACAGVGITVELGERSVSVPLVPKLQVLSFDFASSDFAISAGEDFVLELSARPADPELDQSLRGVRDEECAEDLEIFLEINMDRPLAR